MLRDRAAARGRFALVVTLAGLLARQGALRWVLGAVSNGLWLLALAATLATLLAALSTRRYGFAWETTILQPDTFVTLTQALGGLPRLLGFPVPDAATIRLPFREDLTNDGTYYHGGVISSVMDTAGAAAAWSNHDFTKGARASTVSMTVQYVGACKRSDLVCHGRTVRRGRELVFTEITAEDVDGRVVAHGVQTYRLGTAG